jgi:hypothetical protein
VQPTAVQITAPVLTYPVATLNLILIATHNRVIVDVNNWDLNISVPEMQNESVPTQTIVQTQSAPTLPPVSPPVALPSAKIKLFISRLPQKRIFRYLIVFLIICLIPYVAWGVFRLYLKIFPPQLPGVYACSPEGYCVVYPEQDVAKLCPITFEAPLCDNKCGDIKYRCAK